MSAKIISLFIALALVMSHAGFAADAGKSQKISILDNIKEKIKSFQSSLKTVIGKLNNKLVVLLPKAKIVKSPAGITKSGSGSKSSSSNSGSKAAGKKR